MVGDSLKADINVTTNVEIWSLENLTISAPNYPKSKIIYTKNFFVPPDNHLF